MTKQASTTSLLKIVLFVGILGSISLLWVAIEGLFFIAALRGGISWAVPIGFLVLTIAAVAFVMLFWMKPWQTKKPVAKPVAKQLSPQPVPTRLPDNAVYRAEIPGKSRFQVNFKWNWGWFKSKWPIFAWLAAFLVHRFVLARVFDNLVWVRDNLGWDGAALSKVLFGVEVGFVVAAAYFGIRLIEQIAGMGAYTTVEWLKFTKFLWWRAGLAFLGAFVVTFVINSQVVIFSLVPASIIGLAIWYVEANRTKGAK